MVIVMVKNSFYNNKSIECPKSNIFGMKFAIFLFLLGQLGLMGLMGLMGLYVF